MSALEDIIEAVLAFDPDRVKAAVKKALDQGIDPVKIIDDGLVKGLQIVGKKFEAGELYVSHLMVAGQSVQEIIKDSLEPRIVNTKTSRTTLGKIVIGTVAGDIHDIGKNIVATMLQAEGFEVYDLGKDVPAQSFVEKAAQTHADIIACSALLSTTLPVQEAVVGTLSKKGIRDKHRVIVGGAPVTDEWAKQIGADGYGVDAIDAVHVARKIMQST